MAPNTAGDQLAILDALLLHENPATGGVLVYGDLVVDRQHVCAYCLENTGWCALTGGTHPCEGLDGHVALVAEAADAPLIQVSPGGGVLSGHAYMGSGR